MNANYDTAEHQLRLFGEIDSDYNGLACKSEIQGYLDTLCYQDEDDDESDDDADEDEDDGEDDSDNSEDDDEDSDEEEDDGY